MIGRGVDGSGRGLVLGSAPFLSIPGAIRMISFAIFGSFLSVEELDPLYLPSRDPNALVHRHRSRRAFAAGLIPPLQEQVVGERTDAGDRRFAELANDRLRQTPYVY